MEDMLFVTRQMAASYLGISTHATYRLEAKGVLKPVTFPVGIVRFATAHLASVKAQLQATAGTLPTLQQRTEPTNDWTEAETTSPSPRLRQALLAFESEDAFQRIGESEQVSAC
jgi:hypothetical protein